MLKQAQPAQGIFDFFKLNEAVQARSSGAVPPTSRA
jgi:hypothetical protein